MTLKHEHPIHANRCRDIAGGYPCYCETDCDGEPEGPWARIKELEARLKAAGEAWNKIQAGRKMLRDDAVRELDRALTGEGSGGPKCGAPDCEAVYLDGAEGWLVDADYEAGALGVLCPQHRALTGEGP